MPKDLRTFIDRVKAEAPEQFLEIKKEIDCRFEIPALLQHLEESGKYPMVLFHNVKNVRGKASSLPVISNVAAARERIAMAIDSTIYEVAMDYEKRNLNPIEPIVVDKKNAPVKEVVYTGKDVDLYQLPIVTHHAMDLGPYISAGDAWTKDPETGDVNCAMIRIYARGPKKLTMMWAPVRHTNYYYQKHVARNEPMPMVIVIGHHPAFLMGAQTKILGAELRTIGAMLKEPLELTASETWGDKFYVPARAEIVIEAEVSHTDLDIEAPFGEYTGYYGGQQLGHVADIKAITLRKDAIYQDLFAGHRDHLIMDGPNIEAVVLAKLKDVVPTVKDVYMPPSGKCRFHAYVRFKKTNEAEARSIIATAFTADFRIKHVWVVDEDIDIYNDEEIIWAMATRFQADKDLLVINNIMGSELDPSAREGNKAAKAGFDCTKPAPPEAFEKKVEISREIVDKVKKVGYLTEDALKKLI
jgi:2,5-furandicarboxylate decarboxylase 1